MRMTSDDIGNNTSNDTINDVNNHAVIILASGLSQRLGQSKQLLTQDGEPLIVQMVKLALTTQPQAIIVVIPKNNTEIAQAIDELAAQPVVHIVNNPTPETGMAHSLYLAIDAVAQRVSSHDNSMIDRVLIMATDQLLLDTKHLHKLLAGKHEVVASSYPHLQEADKDFALDKYKANIVGLPISIDYWRLKEWQVALTGDKGLRHLIRALHTEQMSTVINQQLSYDIDTPEQLAYAKQQQWLDS